MAPRTKPKPTLGPHFLREWRNERGITQQVAADSINVSRELLSKIESGKSPYLQHQIEGLAALYRTTVASLIAVNPAGPAPKVSDEAEIRRFIERIEGFTDTDVTVTMAGIMNAMAVRRAVSESSGNHDRSPPANRRREEAPSQ